MGIPGKRRRFRNFEKNAENFAIETSHSTGFRLLTRIGRTFRIGVGAKSRRMIQKSTTHMQKALEHQAWLLEQIAQGSVQPKRFTIEPFTGIIPKQLQKKADQTFSVGVQQYYDKPTIHNLVAYLELKTKGRTECKLSKEEYLLAKRFMKRQEHAGITLKELLGVNKEIANISKTNPDLDSFIYIPWSSNTVVQGVNKNRTLRVTIIDI